MTNQPDNNDASFKAQCEYNEKRLKSARNLAIAGCIAGPTSLILGGVLLGAIGMACAIIAFRRLGKLSHIKGEIGQTASKLRKTCITAITVTGIALAINIAYVIIMLPTIIEIAQSGDYSILYSDVTSVTESAASSTDSIWG